MDSGLVMFCQPEVDEGGADGGIVAVLVPGKKLHVR